MKKALAFLKIYDIIPIEIFEEGESFVIMDDGDSNPDNPAIYHKVVQAKRSTHLLM